MSDFCLDDLFYSSYYNLESEDIIELNEILNSGEINNVVVGLNKQCYGISLISEDLSIFEFQIFYFNGDKRLKGDLIKLKLFTEYRDQLVLYFSVFLAKNYDKLDPVIVYNTFQTHTRSLCEKYGIHTISNLELTKFGRNYEILISNPFVLITYLNKFEVYSEILDSNIFLLEKEINSDYIYLMLNNRNGLIKIGRSKNPSFREKTLQSDEPDIKLIAVWDAPKVLEKELHNRFALKRKRGEWFQLDFSDLIAINNIMKEFK